MGFISFHGGISDRKVRPAEPPSVCTRLLNIVPALFLRDIPPKIISRLLGGYKFNAETTDSTSGNGAVSHCSLRHRALLNLELCTNFIPRSNRPQTNWL
jgi:hypothetical protein